MVKNNFLHPRSKKRAQAYPALKLSKLGRLGPKYKVGSESGIDVPEPVGPRTGWCVDSWSEFGTYISHSFGSFK